MLLGAGAALGGEKTEGPRLSDAELLTCLDPSFSGLDKVIALRDAGQTSSALSAFVSFVRAREEPADFGRRAATGIHAPARPRPREF